MAGGVKQNSRLSQLIQLWFPDRQILVRQGDCIHATNIRQAQQLAVAAGAAIMLGWCVVSPVLFLLLWQGQASATHHARTLQARLAGSQAALARTMSRDAALADAAISAQQRAANFTADAAAKLAALDAQTRSTIARVDEIMRATGLAPKLTAAPQAANQASRLPADIKQLQKLSDVLGKMPLAPPVAALSISSPFGYRPDPWTGVREFHVGIDLRGPEGAPVYATAPGTVEVAGWETGYGQIVEIDHGYGLSTRYSHLDRILVHPGEKVALHQEIGQLGNTGWSTGPHLLYETRLNGAPENPLKFLKVSENDVQD